MSEALLAQPVWLYTATIVFGLIVGSFVNVVILRLPRMMEADWRASAAQILDIAPTDPPAEPRFNLAQPRSRCPQCGQTIAARHNIPVLGFIWLRGRCAGCGARISWQYPAVELASAALGVMVILRFGVTPFTGCALVIGWMLLALAMIDWQTQLLPDSLTLSLLWLGVLASLGYDTGLALVEPRAAIIGAASGYLVLWLIYHGFLLVTGKHGMGHGDFKLLAAIGAWLGWQMLPLVLLLASLGGAIIGAALMASGVLARGKPMPFGPWLALAGWLALLWGDTILHTYLSFAGLA